MKKVFFVMVCGVIGLFLLFGAATFIPDAQASRMLRVDDDWPNSEDTDGDLDFRHIQAAIENLLRFR